MWIRKHQYERIMERLGDLERREGDILPALRNATRDCSELRSQLSYLRDQLRVLIDSLGLVHKQTPSREEYVKKDGPERG